MQYQRSHQNRRVHSRLKTHAIFETTIRNKVRHDTFVFQHTCQQQTGKKDITDLFGKHSLTPYFYLNFTATIFGLDNFVAFPPEQVRRSYLS